MAKHLNDHEIEKVVRLLVGWKGRLTWELLSNACKSAIGRIPSRQTLARAPRVDLAFRTAKDRLKRAEESKSSSNNPSVEVLLQRVARLEAEKLQLEAENRQLLEQFVTWQYNAYGAGLSPDRLNRARPPVDLRPTR
jgi:hypothetical protein